MKSKIELFFCESCDGDGYTAKWENSKKGKIEAKIIEDCDVCKGKGKVEIEVIDKREITKNKKLVYDKRY